MNGKQLQKLLDDAGLTQRGAAHELGINERTMRRYVASPRAIPRIAEYAVRWLVSQRKVK